MFKAIRISKLVAASVLASGLFAGAAMASGPVVVDPEPVLVAPAPAVTDWSGFYGGLSYSDVSGRVNYVNVPVAGPAMVGTSGMGAFAGYNWQRGNVVFGGELNYVAFATPMVGFPTSNQENLTELRARLGYARGRSMAYGFVGAARSNLLDNIGNRFNQTGTVYGLGLQVALNHNMFVGVEVARRDVRGTTGANTVGTLLDTVSLRVGYQF